MEMDIIAQKRLKEVKDFMFYYFTILPMFLDVSAYVDRKEGACGVQHILLEFTRKYHLVDACSAEG